MRRVNCTATLHFQNDLATITLYTALPQHGFTVEHRVNHNQHFTVRTAARGKILPVHGTAFTTHSRAPSMQCAPCLWAPALA